MCTCLGLCSSVCWIKMFNYFKASVVVQDGDPSTRKGKAEESEVQSQLHIEFEVSMDYKEHCLR